MDRKPSVIAEWVRPRCRCNGENENCYICGGKGWINPGDLTDSVVKYGSSRAGRGRRNKSRRRRSVEQVAPQKTSPAPNLATRSGSEPPATGTPAQRTSTPTTLKLGRCSFCKSIVEVGRWARHKRQCVKAASKGTQRPKQSTTAARLPNQNSTPRSAGGNRRDMGTCPSCGTAVRADRLARHLKRCPRAPRVAKERAAPVTSSPNPKPLGPDPRATKAERRMDATREFPHFARERGRFGSPSGYDGFDDDSNP